MSDDPVIKAKFVLDDSATKVLDNIKGGFHKVDKAISDTRKNIQGFVMDAATMAVGFQFNKGIDSVHSFYKEVMDSSKAADAQSRSIAGVLAMHDKSGRKYVELIGDAKDYRKHLADIGIQSGTSAQAVIDAFDEISERSDASAETNEALVKQMVDAGKVVPTGLAGITQGYRMMEAGMMSARNPLVQLITQTHILKGSAREVSHQLTKMGQEAAMKIAGQAIEHTAQQGKGMKLRGPEVQQSIKDMSDEAMIGAGDALRKAMSGPMVIVRDLMLENKGDLEELYTSAGKGMADVITWAVDRGKEGIEYIKLHGTEIKNEIKEGWEYAKKVVDFIISHRKEIGYGLAAVSVAHMAPAAGGMVSSVASSAATGGSALMSLGNFIGTSSVQVPKLAAGIGNLNKGFNGLGAIIYTLPTKIADVGTSFKDMITNMSPATKGLGAMVLAIGAITLAVDQGMKLYNEWFKAEADGKAAHILELERLAKQGNSDDLATALENSRIAGSMNEAEIARIQEMADRANDQYDRVQTAATNALAGVDAGIVDPLVGLGNAYNMAVDFQNIGAEKLAATMLISGSDTYELFTEMGGKIKGGLEEFTKLFEGASEDVLKKLKHWKGEDKPLKALAAHVDLSGSKFEIHQDFRNEDPDRIMLMFREDILKSAEHRMQSRMGTGFGL